MNSARLGRTPPARRTRSCKRVCRVLSACAGGGGARAHGLSEQCLEQCLRRASAGGAVQPRLCHRPNRGPIVADSEFHNKCIAHVPPCNSEGCLWPWRRSPAAATRECMDAHACYQRLADAPARSPSPPERVPSELTIFIPLICCAASEFSDFISLHTCSSFSVRRWMPFSLASNQSPSGLNRPALSPAQIGDGAQSGRAPERRDLRADLSAGGSASAHGSVAAGENACMGRRCSECGYRR